MKKSKTRKKTSVIALTLTLVALLGFFTYWIFTNFETVKSSLDGTKLYTQEEITEAYNKGVSDRKNFENEINEWISKYEISELGKNELQIQINEKQDLIYIKTNEINDLINTNSVLKEDIDVLNNELSTIKAELEELQAEYNAIYNNAINNKLIEAINNNNQYIIAYYDNGLSYKLITKGNTLSNVLPNLDMENFIGWYYDISITEKVVIYTEELNSYTPTSNLVLYPYFTSSTLPI